MTGIEIVFSVIGIGIIIGGFDLRNLRFLLSVKRLSYIQKKISCTPLCAAYFYAIIRIPFLIF